MAGLRLLAQTLGTGGCLGSDATGDFGISSQNRGTSKMSFFRRVFAILARLLPGRTSVSDHVRTPSARSTSVHGDWCTLLPEQKLATFKNYQQLLESTYTMLSVSLNEAMELRHSGLLVKSYQAVCVAPALCTRLTEPLAALLRSLGDHAKHYGTIPNTAPLDPVNFQGAKAQRSARMSNLLSLVVLSQRGQFLHKINTLLEMVEDFGTEFREATGELVEGTSINPETHWRMVDENHFDLNTCLREAIVLLKSFLVALPDDQLEAFQNTFRTQMGGRRNTESKQRRLIPHRRMAQIAGE